MHTLIVIFYVSIVGMIIMLLLKHREVKTGKPSLISRIGQGSDHVFAALFFVIRRGFSYMNKRTFIAFAQLIAFHVLVHVRKIYVEIKHRALINVHSRKVIDMVRGKGEVKKHGASFYLRRITPETKK